MNISLFLTLLCGGHILFSPLFANTTTINQPVKIPTILKLNNTAITFQINPQVKGFQIDITPKEKLITISAAKKNNLIAGYGYYLKHYENLHWSWNGQNLLPHPKLKKRAINHNDSSTKIQIPEQWNWRYAYNYCTLSYTMAFWGKDEWTAEIDRMALNGITHMLVQAGLEKVWQLTLTELGYPKEKIQNFIPNPAAAAWWNMGNLEGHGAPLSQAMIDQEAELGKFIVTRMKNYGIEPVLQGFVGLIPHDLTDYVNLNEAKVLPQGEWCDGFIRPSVLDPTSASYRKIASIWYKNLQKVYGITAKNYGGDLFHEGGNSGDINVSEAAKAVQSTMQNNVPGSCWVLQHWGANPSEELLSKLDKKHALVLSLCKNLSNGNEGNHIRSFFGTPWVWCELLNFGGNQGLYGSLKVLGGLGKLQTSAEKDKLKGIGILSEGGETNPIFYDLFYDRMWMNKNVVMSESKLSEWIKNYLFRRYGLHSIKAREAFSFLEKSVYSPTKEQEGCTESILCARPSKDAQKASSWASGGIYYDPNDVLKAANLLLEAGKGYPELRKTDTYNFDLIDVTRQVLSDLARPLLEKTMRAYDQGDLVAFNSLSDQFIDLIRSTDQLCATHTLWRFGRMYQMAERKGKTPEEKKNMTTAAKRMVTLWGNRIGSLNDYSHRQLSGLMKDFYQKRWELFFNTHKKALSGELDKQEVNNDYLKAVHAFETSWIENSTTYSEKTEGNSYQIASEIYQKFLPLAKELFQNSPSDLCRKWNLQEGISELTYDVSDEIMTTGTYTATFEWKEGDSALRIKKVTLYEGSKIVTQDIHEGWTGLEHRKNVYSLEIPKLRTNLDSYTIKAEVEGVSSQNSKGTFLFKKAK